MRLVWVAGMHDEAAEHAHHFLHGHVRVVEVSSRLVDVEFIDEATAGLDRFLADARHAVVTNHVFEAVPVNGACFGEMVIEDHADVIALVDLNGRSRGTAVESPGVDGLVGMDFLLDDFTGEVEDLGVAIEGVGQVAYVCGDDRVGWGGAVAWGRAWF